MIKNEQIKRYIKFFDYILSFVNILVIIRIFILEVDIDKFRNSQTGELSALGEKLKFSQMIFENITEPLVVPFINLLSHIFPNAETGLINIFAPVFVIIFILFLRLILKLSTPHIIFFIRNLQD